MTVPTLLDTSKVIVGASGSGKTVTAKREVEQLLAERRHVLVVDPTGVWWGLRSNPAGDGPGFDIPIFGGEHGDVPVRPTQGAAIAHIVVEQRVSAIVDLSSIDNSRDWRTFMRDLVAELRRLVRGNFHLIVDEADEFAAERPADDVGFALREDLVWIAKRGRAAGFVPTWVTQRTAEIAKAVISQAQTIVAHQLIAPSDRKAIDDYLKGHGTAEARAEVMGSLAGLGIGERWIYSPRLQLLERGVTPALDTFDSSRTPAPGEQPVEARTLAQLDVSAIAAALTPAELPDDVIPADAAAAYVKGGVVGGMIVERDRRIEELEAEVAGLREREASLVHWLTQIRLRVTPAYDSLRELIAARWPIEIETAPAPDGAEAATPAVVPGVPPTADVASDLPPRRQRILAAIAWVAAYLKRANAPRSVVAWIAGTTASSSTFERDCGALRTAGLIDYPEAGMLALTVAGAAVTPRPDTPTTRAALWHAIAAQLPPRRVRIVEALWSGNPRWRAELAQAVDTSPSSSTFERDLGALRSLGLIDYPTQGAVQLAELLR